MRSSTIGLALAAWFFLLLNGVWGAFVPKLLPRQTQSAANPTDLWVTVDESGRPKTVTPILTTISGTPTIISGAPYQVTGTVFTQTRADVKITTSTGAEQPKATGSDGSGSFALCRNRDGDHAPFCEPKNNATIYPGATHYVTWDPSFFNTTNTTVRVVGFYNETEEAFSSDLIAAGWGFVSSRRRSNQKVRSDQITLVPMGRQVGALLLQAQAWREHYIPSRRPPGWQVGAVGAWAHCSGHYLTNPHPRTLKATIRRGPLYCHPDGVGLCCPDGVRYLHLEPQGSQD